MDKVTVVRVWAWACPECQAVNLGQETPRVDAEVVCGTGYTDGPYAGCGTVGEIGDIDRAPIRLVRHDEVKYTAVAVRVVRP